MGDDIAVKSEKKGVVLSKKALCIILGVMIFLQVGIVFYFFAFVKEGFHSDEPWSYGLANSFYAPHIYAEKLGENSKLSVWTDGEVFSDYLTVGDNERFRYDSVWFNQTNDMHPPLYFTVLHTICSFFPNQFSKWFAFPINVISMVIGQIFLFKAARLICKSDVLGLVVCAVWGFGTGFQNVNMFLRMYSPLVMFGAMFIYYQARVYYCEGSMKKNLIKLSIVTLLGALTHHYFLLPAFAITACFCFYFLFKKQFKMMFLYAAAVAGGVILSLIIFPGTIEHLLCFDNKATKLGLLVMMPLPNAARSCLSLILSSTVGVFITPYSTGSYAVPVIIMFSIIALAVPLCFLFRNEDWFKKVSGKVISGVKYFFAHFDFMLLFIVISIIFTVVAVSLLVNVNVMNVYTDRYIFIIMPWAVIAMVKAANYIINIIKPLRKYSKQIISGIACLAIVNCNIVSDRRYLFPRYIMGEGGIETTCSENSSYIFMLYEEWQLVIFSDKLLGCDDIFPVKFSQYDKYKDEIAKLNLENDCYICWDASYITRYEDYLDDYSDNELVKYNIEDTTKFEEAPTEEEIIKDFEENIFPGYKLQFYSSELDFGVLLHTFKLVPESEYVDVPITDYTMEINE